MKSTELKTLIKEAVREAIQEELKDILLEAVRSPKTVVQETYKPEPSTVNPPPTKSYAEKRAMYESMVSDMKTLSFGANDARSMGIEANTFRPRAIDQSNGALPEGNVGLDQIMGLMNTK